MPLLPAAAAIISGLLLYFSSPGTSGHPLLAWLALVPLLLALRGRGWRQAAALGLLAGLVYHLPLLRWLLVVLGEHGGVLLPVALLALLLLALYMSLYLALFAALFNTLTGWGKATLPNVTFHEAEPLASDQGVPRVQATANGTEGNWRKNRGQTPNFTGPEVLALWAGPVIWVGLDRLRAWLFTGFPWQDLAYSQYQWPLVIQAADLFGHHGITFVIVQTNLLLALLLVAGGVTVQQHRIFGRSARLEYTGYEAPGCLPESAALLNGYVPLGQQAREKSESDQNSSSNFSPTLSLPHRWILSRSSRVAAEVGAALDDYRFNDAASIAYQFVWKEFCDWYLEWIKPELYGEDQAVKQASRTVLLTVLEDILKILHPMIPFVTEEIWHALPGERRSIMMAPFPAADPAREDRRAEALAELLMEAVGAIRNIRSENQLHPSATIKVEIICPDLDKAAALGELSEAIKGLTRSESITIAPDGERPKGSAAQILPDLSVFVPLAGLVDVEAESAKLERERAKLNQELARIQGKLNNEKFLAKAPPEVVAKEREKEAELTATLNTIAENLTKLTELR